MARQRLESRVQFWGPQFSTLIHWRGVGEEPRVKGLENLPYRDRPKELNVFGLTKRQFMGDWIPVRKYRRGERIQNNGLLRQAEEGLTPSSGWPLKLDTFRLALGGNVMAVAVQSTEGRGRFSIPGSFYVAIGCFSESSALVQPGLNSGASLACAVQVRLDVSCLTSEAVTP